MGSEDYSCTRAVAVAAVLFIAAAVQPAGAADEKHWDRFALKVAMFRPDINTEVRLDPVVGSFGTQLDFENDLKLEDSSDLWQVDARLRLTKRVALEASYLEIGRSGQSTLSTGIDFGNVSFPVSADANTEFNTDIIAGSLRYSFIHNKAVEFAASLGAYWMQLEAGIEVPALTLAESADVGVPLPLIGMDFSYNFTRRFMLTAQGRYFGVEIEDIDGSLINYNVGLQFNIFDSFGIGAGYESFDFDVDSNNEDFPGFVRFEYKGPKIFTTIQF